MRKTNCVMTIQDHKRELEGKIEDLLLKFVIDNKGHYIHSVNVDRFDYIADVPNHYRVKCEVVVRD